jgi:predicted ABC-type ATPase
MELLDALFAGNLATKFNPNHDAAGRFASGSGGGSGGGAPSKSAYLAQADAMLASTSRTASGTIDTSASANKKDQFAAGAADSAKEQSTKNFRDTMGRLHDERNKKFESPEELDEYIDGVAKDINKGILKEGVLLRQEDSTKFPYTSVADLPAAKKQFAQELHARLDDPDAQATAAWAVWRLNFTDHSYADGVGRVSNSVAAWILMRHGDSLPTFRGRKEMFENVKTRKQVKPDAKGDNYRGPELDHWTGYFKTLFPAEKKAMHLLDSLFGGELEAKYSPSQPRDAHGRFATGRGSAAAVGAATGAESALSQGGTAGGGMTREDEVISRPSSYYKPLNDQGRDTEEKFKEGESGKPGRWTAQREELHDAIIGKLSKGVTKSENPTVFMTGGGPASGKSSLMKAGHFAEPKNAVKVDADGIKDMLPEYREMLASGNPRAAATAHEESSHITKRAIAHGLSNQNDVFWDGTGDSGYDSLKGKVDKMKAAGHRVVAHYVTVDVETAVARNNARFAMPASQGGGRLVPESVVRGTHKTVSQVLPRAMEDGLFDEVTLWDTNAGPPRKVASGKGKSFTIHDQDLWMAFLAKGND